jgi:competence protein ComEC
LGAVVVGCLAGWRFAWWGGALVLAVGGLGLLTHRGCNADVLLLAIGAAWLRWEAVLTSPFHALPDGAPVVVEGTVLERVERDATGVSITVRGWVMPRDGSRGAHGAVRLRCAVVPGTVAPSWRVGARIRAYGRLAQPTGVRNPGGFDGRLFAASRGVEGGVLVRSPERVIVLERNTPSLRPVLDGFRGRLLAPVEAALPSPYDALFAGALLGDKRDIPDAIVDAFVRSGVVHVLVVSGANFALVTGLVYLLLRAVCIPLRGVYAATMGFAFLFAAIVGFSAPVVRAGVLVELYLFARLYGRDATPGNLVALSAFLILLAHPPALFDVSFQLSFGATAGLVFFLPRWNAVLAPIRERVCRNRFGRFAWMWFVQTFLATFAVELVLTPALAWHFGRFTWVGVLANLPVVLLIAGISVASAMAAFAGLVYAPVGGFLANAALGGFALLLPVVRWFAQLPNASVLAVRPTVPELLLYGTLVAVLFVPESWRPLRERPARWVIVGTACLGCGLWCVADRARSRLLEVTFLDVGQGDAAFLRFPTGKRLVVDAGSDAEDDDFDSGERIVAPFLTANGYRRLDTVVESHADNDHAGGLPFLVRTFPVNEFVGLPPTPLGSPTDAAVRDALRHAANPSLAVRFGAGGTLYDSVHEGKALRASILYPAVGETPDYTDGNTNNDSLVLGVTYGDVRLLFAGDIEREVEETLVQRHALGAVDLRADALKVPHHGSQTSSTAGFLSAVRPRVAVVSVGSRNRYGHPSAQALARYEADGIRVYRTDREGAVRLWTDGHRVWVRGTVRTR